MEKNTFNDPRNAQKIVKSPLAANMYAFATSKNGRTQVWFKDKESLTRFLGTDGNSEYKVNISGEMKE